MSPGLDRSAPAKVVSTYWIVRVMLPFENAFRISGILDHIIVRDKPPQSWWTTGDDFCFGWQNNYTIILHEIIMHLPCVAVLGSCGSACLPVSGLRAGNSNEHFWLFFTYPLKSKSTSECQWIFIPTYELFMLCKSRQCCISRCPNCMMFVYTQKLFEFLYRNNLTRDGL